jgi:hypothetical protein
VTTNKAINARRYTSYHMTVKRSIEKFGEAKTKEIIKKELEQMLEMDVWTPVYYDSLLEKEAKKIIRSSLFIKDKYFADGKFDKLKARLVAGGNTQDRTIYSDNEISSPTVSTTSVFTIALIAAKEGRRVVKMDIGGAYLNADLKFRDVYMKLQKKISETLCEIDGNYRKYMGKDNTLTVKLKKALYGCIESARLWYNHITNILSDLGFTMNKADKCVWNKTDPISGDQITIYIYVDDLLITCRQKSALNGTILDIDSKFKSTTVEQGPMLSYLGVEYDFSERNIVTLSMSGYINELLSEYEVQGYAVSPATDDLFKSNEDDERLDKEQSEIFHSRVSKLLYLAKRVRPDILTAVAYLSTTVQCSTVKDMEKLNRVLRYINKTKDLVLRLDCNDPMVILASIDASYAAHSDLK